MHKVIKPAHQCTKCMQMVNGEIREYYCDSCDKKLDTNKSDGYVYIDVEYVNDGVDAPELMFCGTTCIIDWMVKGGYDKYYNKYGNKKKGQEMDISMFRHMKPKEVRKLISRLK